MLKFATKEKVECTVTVIPVLTTRVMSQATEGEERMGLESIGNIYSSIVARCYEIYLHYHRNLKNADLMLKLVIFRYLKILSFYFSCLVFLLFCTLANAFDAKQPLAKENLVALYRKGAFAHNDGRLVRFSNTEAVKIDVVCLARTCEDGNQRLRKVLRANSFQVTNSTLFKEESPISIIFFDSSTSFDANSEDFTGAFKGSAYHVTQDGSGNCRSVTSQEDHEIKKLIIFVDYDLIEPKRETCVLIKLLRGSGWGFSQSFSSAWSEPNGFQQLDENQMRSTIQAFGWALALHFLPNVKPGLNYQEFSSVLEGYTLGQILGVEQ